MIPYEYIRNMWYAIGFSTEFQTEQLQAHTVVRKPIVAWRTAAGEVVAFDNRCAHKRMPLSAGRILADGTVECAYHGLCYDHTGQCVKVPSHPDGAIPPQAKLRPYPVIEQDGLVWLWSGDPALADTIKPPGTPEIGSDDYETAGSEPMQAPANYLLLIENLLDISHFYPLHDGNIGDYANSLIPVQLEEGEVDGNRYVKAIREVENYQQPPFLEDWFGYDIVDRHHTHCMVSPGLTRVQMRVAPPGQLGTDSERGYVLYHTHTPVDEKNHVWRWCVNTKAGLRCKSDPAKSTVARFAETFPAVAAEDLWALEKQQEMFDFADDGYSEVHLKPDGALRRVRQIFARLQHQERKAQPASKPIADAAD